MAYVNTSHFDEGDMETSNYSELTQRNEGDAPYSKIKYDRRTETVGLSATNLEPSNIVQRPNIHTRVIGHDSIEKSTDKLSVKCTCQQLNLKLILVIVGMIVIAAVSSTITALLLKQNFDNHLTNIREEMDSIKQNIGQESAWSKWSDWGECSAPCNGGIQSRLRTCDASDKGLSLCVGTDVDIIACNNNTCEDKIWSTWSPWGDCSVTCNGGMKTRTRICDGTDQGEPQGSCSGTNMDIGGCNNKACFVPMVYFTMHSPNRLLVSGKVTFSRTLANIGGGYNNQTGAFVGPVAGLYHFFFSFTQTSTTSVWCYIKHNDIYLTAAYTYSDGTRDAASTSAYIQLAVGDVVTVGDCVNWQYVNHGGDSCVFTGSLIHL